MRAIVGLALAGLCLASAGVQADELPRRKAGQWEVKMSGTGGMPPMTAQHCVDEKTDAAMQKRATQADGADCSRQSFRKTGSGFEFDSVCKVSGTTMTTHGVATGDYDRAYAIDMTTRYQPALHGMTEQKMRIDARYLGACKGGMKPGDISMNGMTFNMLEGGAMGAGKKVKPEDMQRLIEQMKKQQGMQ